MPLSEEFHSSGGIVIAEPKLNEFAAEVIINEIEGDLKPDRHREARDIQAFIDALPEGHRDAAAVLALRSFLSEQLQTTSSTIIADALERLEELIEMFHDLPADIPDA